MNDLEREEARRWYKKQEDLKTLKGKLAIEIAEQQARRKSASTEILRQYSSDYRPPAKINTEKLTLV